MSNNLTQTTLENKLKERMIMYNNLTPLPLRVVNKLKEFNTFYEALDREVFYDITMGNCNIKNNPFVEVKKKLDEVLECVIDEINLQKMSNQDILKLYKGKKVYWVDNTRELRDAVVDDKFVKEMGNSIKKYGRFYLTLMEAEYERVNIAIADFILRESGDYSDEYKYEIVIYHNSKLVEMEKDANAVNSATSGKYVKEGTLRKLNLMFGDDAVLEHFMSKDLELDVSDNRSGLAHPLYNYISRINAIELIKLRTIAIYKIERYYEVLSSANGNAINTNTDKIDDKEDIPKESLDSLFGTFYKIEDLDEEGNPKFINDSVDKAKDLDNKREKKILDKFKKKNKDK